MLKSLPQPTRRNAPWTPFQRRTWLAEQRRQHRLQFAPDDAPLPSLLLAGLLAYWPLDEESVTWFDSVGTNHLSGSVLSMAGFIGNCVYAPDFAGGNSDGVYLMPSAPLGLDASATGPGFSISFWARPTSLANQNSDWNPLFSLAAAGGSFSPTLVLAATGTTGDYYFYSDYTSEGGLVPGLTAEVWTQVAVVFDRVRDEIRLYRDSVMVATLAIDLTPATETFDTLTLFSWPWNLEINCFNGALDEFAVWQRALSAEEVDQLYNSGSGLAYENF
jgi:hypothetical protein